MTQKSIPSFYTSIKNHYDSIFPFNSKQGEFVANWIPHPGPILDIGCATGSLIVALAKQQYSVTGIDLDAELVKIAQSKLGQSLRTNSVIQGDMQDIQHLFPAHSFLGATCFGNTLSHLQKDALYPFFLQIKKLLKPNGILIAQIISYQRLVAKQLQALPTIENEQVQFIRKYEHFDGQTPFVFYSQLRDKQTGVVVENRIPLHPHSKTQLSKNLNDAGFQNVHWFGTYNQDPPGMDYLPLIFAAQMGALE